MFKKGDRVQVVGPTKWLEEVCVSNKEGAVGTIFVTGSVGTIHLKGRGFSSVFRVKLDGSSEGIVHHIPGPCLEKLKE